MNAWNVGKLSLTSLFFIFIFIVYSITVVTFSLPLSSPLIHKFSLIIHQRIHIGEKLYRYSECGKTSPIKFSLILHQNTHRRETP